VYHRDAAVRLLQKQRLRLHLPDFAEPPRQSDPLAVVVAENPQHPTRQSLQFVHHERRDIVPRVQRQLHLQVAQRVHRATQVAQDGRACPTRRRCAYHLNSSPFPRFLPFKTLLANL
jgi:hypothetical protein